jgi:hypothetical protein
MSDPELSDAGHPVPVNRIAHIAGNGQVEMVGAPPPTAGPEAAGHVVDLESPPGMIDIVPALARSKRPEYDLPSLHRGPRYHSFYTLVRDEIRSGRTPDEVRAQLFPLIERAGDLIDTVRDALEDALAGRPPKYEERTGL